MLLAVGFPSPYLNRSDYYGLMVDSSTLAAVLTADVAFINLYRVIRLMNNSTRGSGSIRLSEKVVVLSQNAVVLVKRLAHSPKSLG